MDWIISNYPVMGGFITMYILGRLHESGEERLVFALAAIGAGWAWPCVMAIWV